MTEKEGIEKLKEICNKVKEQKEKVSESMDNVRKTCEDGLVVTIEQMIEVFKKTDKETQLREFGQGRVAVSCLDNIVKMVQTLSNERRKEMVEKFPELDILFMHTLGYLELGLIFGYTEKNNKDK